MALIRQVRKLDHIKYAVQMGEPFLSNGFADIHLVHQSLPGLALEEIDTTTLFLNKKLAAPFLVNAMTGGHPELAKINKSLARVARKTSIAMAVGSQKAGLEDAALRFTYTVARKENPDGVLLANMSASCRPEEAAAAVGMIAADGLQLFLNAPQEVVMKEGERDFRHLLSNIIAIKKQVRVPVIVKETGFGMSRETINELYRAGIEYIDVGGQGGTNFIYIENCRLNSDPNTIYNGSELTRWGIPTAISLLEGLSLGVPVSLIASGGITKATEAAKALATGATLAGLARWFLKVLLNESEKSLLKKVQLLIEDLRRIMLFTGSRNLEELRKKPVIITGQTAAWLQQRGIDLDFMHRRNAWQEK